jgi:uncharacterized protein
MSLTMYQASAPLFKTLLGALSKVLDKGAAFCEAKKVDPAVLVGARLAPDMFTLARQVQIASDMARGAMARLSGGEPESWEDKEATFDELKARIARTLAFIDGFKPEQINGSEGREITLKMGGNPRTFTGERYLIGFVIPNVTFHCTTAYAILRHNGVDVGKRDFLGDF